MGAVEKIGQFLLRKVLQACLRASGGIEWKRPDVAVPLKIFNQACVQDGNQLRHRAETATNELIPRPADQGLHLRVTNRVVTPLDEDEPLYAMCRGMVEFPLSRRDPFGVLITVFVAEEAYIDGAALNLVQIDRIGALVGSGQALEQKHLEKPAQERVAMDILFQGATLISQFFLYRADE